MTRTPFEIAGDLVGELCRDGRAVYYLNMPEDAELAEFDSKHAAQWAALRAGLVPEYRPSQSQVFGQFRVELEPVEDRDSVWVAVTHWPTKVSNSLDYLSDNGEFDDLPRDSDNPVRINQKTLDAIETWALANGY